MKAKTDQLNERRGRLQREDKAIPSIIKGVMASADYKDVRMMRSSSDAITQSYLEAQVRQKALRNKDNQGATCQARCMTQEQFRSFHQEHTRSSSPPYLLEFLLRIDIQDNRSNNKIYEGPRLCIGCPACKGHNDIASKASLGEVTS